MHSRKKLKLELRKFGLNPEEWLLLQEQGTQFLILNKFDRNFQLTGISTDSAANGSQTRETLWKSIELKQL